MWKESNARRHHMNFMRISHEKFHFMALVTTWNLHILPMYTFKDISATKLWSYNRFCCLCFTEERKTELEDVTGVKIVRAGIVYKVSQNLRYNYILYIIKKDVCLRKWIYGKKELGCKLKYNLHWVLDYFPWKCTKTNLNYSYVVCEETLNCNEIIGQKSLNVYQAY